MSLKMKKLRALMCVPMMLALLAFPTKVSAQESGCAVTIPVSVEVSGTSAPADTEFEVVLTSLDAGEPMPESSSAVVKGSGQAEFGPMTYTVPGDYHYSISQKKGNAVNYTYDTSIYTVTVRVVNAENGGLTAEVWAVKDGQSDKADKIVFANEYSAPKAPEKPAGPTQTPQTGDASNVNLFAALLAASVLVMLIIGIRGRRRGER